MRLEGWGGDAWCMTHGNGPVGSLPAQLALAVRQITIPSLSLKKSSLSSASLLPLGILASRALLYTSFHDAPSSTPWRTSAMKTGLLPVRTIGRPPVRGRRRRTNKPMCMHRRATKTSAEKRKGEEEKGEGRGERRAKRDANHRQVCVAHRDFGPPTNRPCRRARWCRGHMEMSVAAPTTKAREAATFSIL